jgi:ABC-type multidrug transport system ATPase subunit
MDVIAMRKTSGTITGDIKLNGFPQERISFLRCSGYVEQFDVQQAELTVRETVVFCARLRLDASNPAINDDAGKLRFVDHVLETMELTDIQTLQVGSYEEGGLTFEQRKRLAIACELAGECCVLIGFGCTCSWFLTRLLWSFGDCPLFVEKGSPSVVFCDEPTSGLDSRGALVVMRAMKRIADTGRTVCATIHQPSSAVFEMFDDLILLKKGGNVVFFGELGQGSVKLIEYFESRGAPPIEYGENPAAWMLRAYAGEHAAENVDFAEVYKESEQYKVLCEQIQAIEDSRDESKKIFYDDVFATTSNERMELMNRRIVTIYRRSPAYNLTRLIIAVFYSFLIGSVFLRNSSQRSDGWEEKEVDGVLGTIFLATIIIGVTSISMAVPVMKKIRDVFYKHRASGMLQHSSLSFALAVGECPYILLVSLLFGVVYYFTVGLFKTAEKFFLFWLFFTLNVAIYGFFGQAFICMVPDIPTSGALVGALIGYNVFFSGFIVKPQYFTGPFQLGLWTAPGRFAYEGITMTQFENINVPVYAEPLSPFFFSLNCTDVEESCAGTMDEYVSFYFGGKFTIDNFWLDLFVLIGYVLLARFLIWFSLKKFNYVNT